MGYYTNFSGKFRFSKKLNEDQVNYLNTFFNSRRMIRDVSKIKDLPDTIREKVDLPLGVEGEFFVAEDGHFFDNSINSGVLDYNTPPSTQPSLWCNFTATSKDLKLIDGKNYNFIEWAEYIQKNFLDRWGIKLDGKVKWMGEEKYDRGIILANNGQISFLEGKEYKEYLNNIKLKIKIEEELKEEIHNAKPKKKFKI